MFQRLGNRQICKTDLFAQLLVSPQWNSFQISRGKHVFPLQYSVILWGKCTIIKLVSQPFSICYTLFWQSNITVSTPFSWTSWLRIVLPNDIVEEFARLLFHKLQKVAIFTKLCKGFPFYVSVQTTWKEHNQLLIRLLSMPSFFQLHNVG